MDKKTIISKTILFLLIVVGIATFQQVFGSENTLVGVTIITAGLMFMERDLTSTPIKFLIFFSVINVMQGVFAYYTAFYPILGVLLTFISMFLTGYLFTYNMRKPMYVAFGLQYLFMVYSPVTSEQLPMRLLALLFGAVFIMALQLLVNRNRLEKASKGIVPGITNLLENKIRTIINGDYNGEYDRDIINSIIKLNSCVQENRQDYFHITVEGKVNFNLSIAMERINILVDRIAANHGDTPEYKEFLNSIADILKDLTVDRNNIEGINNKIEEIERFLEKYKVIFEYENDNIGISHENIREVLENMDFLMTTLQDIIKFNNKNYKKYVKKQNIPKHFNVNSVLKGEFNRKSIKFSYAFKSALLISLSIGIVEYFNIPEGRWIVFSILAITQPYKQDSSAKSRTRIKGTIAGIIGFCVLFMIIKDPTIRSLLLMLSGYLCSFQSRYDRQMAFITFSALGAASLTAAAGEGGELIFYRVLYVAIGTGIALLGNKIILPYGIEDSTSYLMDTYNRIITEIKKEIDLASKGEGHIDIVRNLVMQVNLIEGRVHSNLGIEDSGDPTSKEEIKDTLFKNRILINDLYDEYLGAYKKPKYTA
ncbi:MAG: FUSC family protein [Clostridium sp.]